LALQLPCVLVAVSSVALEGSVATNDVLVALALPLSLTVRL
jgi:hypothetical protein